jgi:hypothetical protein
LVGAEVTLLQSLRIDALDGSDTIIVESLPENFSGSLFLYGNRLQRNDLFYPNMPEDDPYPDSVVISGDISLSYLEVFADHITVSDNVHIVTGDDGIFFRPRQIGVATFENLLPGFGTNRSVSVDIGENAVLEGGNIYFVVQAEDKSFADVIGAGKEVSNFVIDPLTEFLGDALALPVKVLVKQSTATITLRDGAQLLSGGTIGIYATATADASGAAYSSLVSIGYVDANATATIDIRKGVVIDAGAAVVVTSTGNATASISSSTERDLDPFFNLVMSDTGPVELRLTDAPSVAIAIGVTNANVTSHVSVAEGASITAGKTANVMATGEVNTEASGEAGLDSRGAAGLGLGIQISNADIHTQVDGSITALARAGYTVKNEIDPLLAKSDYDSNAQAFGLMTGKTVELKTTVNSDLPAGTVMRYIGAPVADTVNLAVSAQDYTDDSLWEITTPPVGYVDYASDRIFLGDVALNGLVTEDVINYTNRRGTSIGGLVDNASYYLIADLDDPGYFWLAETETQAVRASLGYLTNNVVPLDPQAGPTTENNEREFAGSNVDADANTISLPRTATVNNTFELGQAVVFHAPSTEFTSGDIQANLIRVPDQGERTIRDFAIGDAVTYVGVGIPASTSTGQLEDGATYYVSAVVGDRIRLSETRGGLPLVLSPNLDTPGKTAVVHKLTRVIEGLVDGATYYVAASTNQTNLQGNSRFTETQVIGLSELENEARGGVLIDIGAATGSGYYLAAKHVLDSGFATGIGVVAELSAETNASASAGLASQDRDQTWSKYLDVISTNVPDLLISKLTDLANFSSASPLAAAGALAITSSNHSVLTDVGSRAVLKSNEDLEVKALISQNYSLAAESHVEPQEDPLSGESAPDLGVSVAVNIGNINNTAIATLHWDPETGEAATLDGLRVTRVISDVSYPFLTRPDEYLPLSWGELVDSIRSEGPDSITKYLTSTMGLKEAFFNSWGGQHRRGREVEHRSLGECRGGDQRFPGDRQVGRSDQSGPGLA